MVIFHGQLLNNQIVDAIPSTVSTVENVENFQKSINIQKIHILVTSQMGYLIPQENNVLWHK